MYSCKKCYTCTNECTRCFRVVSGNTFEQTYCSTDTPYINMAQYKAQIAADSANGFTCNKAASNYTDEYCTNKPGEDPYKNYYNAGGKVSCTEK